MHARARLLVAAAAGLAVAALALPATAGPPGSEVQRLKRHVTALTAQLKRLKAERTSLRAGTKEALERERALLARIAAADACGITRPNGSRPPGSTFGAEFHGGGALWVGVPPSNVVLARPAADGSVSTKFGWWREAVGRLTVEGRRLDGAAPPLQATVGDGYGDRGFQSSSLTFPSPGCWQVTGRVGAASLTFVTLALAASP